MSDFERSSCKPTTTNQITGEFRGSVNIQGVEHPFQSNYVYRDEQQGGLRFFGLMEHSTGLYDRDAIHVEFNNSGAPDGTYAVGGGGDVHLRELRYAPPGDRYGYPAQSGTVLFRRNDAETTINGRVEFEFTHGTTHYKIDAIFSIKGMA
jgi:hypothetical protein